MGKDAGIKGLKGIHILITISESIDVIDCWLKSPEDRIHLDEPTDIVHDWLPNSITPTELTEELEEVRAKHEEERVEETDEERLMRECEEGAMFDEYLREMYENNELVDTPFGKGWMGRNAEIRGVDCVSGGPKGIIIFITISESVDVIDCCIESTKDTKDEICLGLPTDVTNNWFHTSMSWEGWSEERTEERERPEEEEEIMAEMRIGEMEMLEEMRWRPKCGKLYKKIPRYNFNVRDALKF
ncbi:Hypothetical predicted protein [Paramuricea clavata]|uniref:Uncharacterized protein n=1 Tax=Paramuricea clavata TaxID=317549 RepID=A0A7D9E1G2_PARCT|nr:Hypothetical predicted protein [Paramuricea clavata]